MTQPNSMTQASSHLTPRTFAGVVATTALITTIGLLHVTAPQAIGAVEDAAPVFSAPLQVDNAYFPIVPGAVKVFLGKEGRENVTVVVTHRTDTREFEWDGQIVNCRIVQELKFVRGGLREQAVTYFAQSDGGDVFFFGETETHDADDDDESDHDEDDTGGWIVGSIAPTDPPDTVSVSNPTVFMPANPTPGSSWRAVDVDDVQQETFRVVDDRRRLRVLSSRHNNVLRIRESAPDGGLETKWYVPGIGFARSASSNERLRLNATSLTGIE